MIKLLSLFSGVGAFESALDRLDVDYELVSYCELDKYASKSYSVIHNVDESLNLWDIKKVDTSKLPDDIDLVTYGFPCQDISVAGKQKGFESDGELTRSGLFYEALRIIKDTQPKIAIAENVKNLVGKRFKKEFDIVLTSLEQAGYKNYWKVLNAKDFGVPQQRERVFIISIRKDLDKGYEFPKGMPLEKRLKDILEQEVDEKYYLNEKQIERLRSTSYNSSSYDYRVADEDSVSRALCARDYKDPKCVTIASMYGNCQSGRVYDFNGLSPSLNTCQGGNTMPFIPIKENTKKGYAIANVGDSVNISYPNSKTRRGRVGKGVSQTLTTSGDNMSVVEDNVIVRKLTPLECWRLMGFTDEEFSKAQLVCSDSQLYKQAGNSIVVNVLVELYKKIIEKKWNCNLKEDE